MDFCQIAGKDNSLCGFNNPKVLSFLLPF